MISWIKEKLCCGDDRKNESHQGDIIDKRSCNKQWYH